MILMHTKPTQQGNILNFPMTFQHYMSMAAWTPRETNRVSHLWSERMSEFQGLKMSEQLGALDREQKLFIFSTYL